TGHGAVHQRLLARADDAACHNGADEEAAADAAFRHELEPRQRPAMHVLETGEPVVSGVSAEAAEAGEPGSRGTVLAVLRQARPKAASGGPGDAARKRKR